MTCTNSLYYEPFFRELINVDFSSIKGKWLYWTLINQNTTLQGLLVWTTKYQISFEICLVILKKK